MLSAFPQAWQSWKSARAVAVLAILAFAVGIGSATAIYTVVNAVVLKPLPYPQAERFVALYGASFSQPGQRGSLTFPDLLEYQQRTHSFDVFGWFRPRAFNMTFAGQAPQHLVGTAVTPSLITGLGVSPIVGQWFARDDAVVIAYSLWRRLGSDPQIVGKALTLDGRTYTFVSRCLAPAWSASTARSGSRSIRWAKGRTDRKAPSFVTRGSRPASASRRPTPT
jgi:putative ABC transport system permease protein